MTTPTAAFQLGRVKLDNIPPNRLSSLARYGLGTKAAKPERSSEPKRTAMLTAVMRHLETKAIDDALGLFEILVATRLISAAKRSTHKQRLSTLPQLEKASRLVARAAVFIEELELIGQTGCDVDVACGRRWRRSPAPVARIAREVGYPGPAYFTRVFTRHVGTTPTAFRRQQQQRTA